MIAPQKLSPARLKEIEIENNIPPNQMWGREIAIRELLSHIAWLESEIERPKQSVTKAELIAKLIELQTVNDTHTAHFNADDALLEFINDPEVEAAYDAIEKWYA